MRACQCKLAKCVSAAPMQQRRSKTTNPTTTTTTTNNNNNNNGTSSSSKLPSQLRSSHTGVDLPSINFEHFIEYNVDACCCLSGSAGSSDKADSSHLGQSKSTADHHPKVAFDNNVHTVAGDSDFAVPLVLDQHCHAGPVGNGRLGPSPREYLTDPPSDEYITQIRGTPIFNSTSRRPLAHVCPAVPDSVDDRMGHVKATCSRDLFISPPSSPVWQRHSGIGHLSDLEITGSDPNLILIREQKQDTTLASESRPFDGASKRPNPHRLIKYEKAGTNPRHRYRENRCESPYHSNYKQNASWLQIMYRKRCYRIGISLFNRDPASGLSFLVEHGFITDEPADIARFLIEGKGLSREVIGCLLEKILPNLLIDVIDALDFCGMEIDLALRRFQSYFRMSNESQCIERIVNVFARRYSACNPNYMLDEESVEILAYAILILNTDMHNMKIREDERMTCNQFLMNTKGVPQLENVDEFSLKQIYYRVKDCQFTSIPDHVSLVEKIQQKITGMNVDLSRKLDRRLICACRLYECRGAGKKVSQQRDVFLFSDQLVVTKSFIKKKQVYYSAKHVFHLDKISIATETNGSIPLSVSIFRKPDSEKILTLSAISPHDQIRFSEDIVEAIAEISELQLIQLYESLAQCYMIGLKRGMSCQDPQDNKSSRRRDRHRSTSVRRSSQQNVQNHPHATDPTASSGYGMRNIPFKDTSTSFAAIVRPTGASKSISMMNGL